MDVNPLILGSSMVPFRRYKDGSNLKDWVRTAASEALSDAAIDPGDIDAVVFASETDFMSLQVAPGSLLVDEIGLVGRPVVRVETGGASGGAALRVGVMHVLSGLARRVLVIGYENAASHLSGDDVRSVYGLSFDADLEGWAGATATMLYALSIQEHMARWGTTSEQLAAVSVKNHGNACLNPLAHSPMTISVEDVLASPMVNTPYRRLDCSLISDGAAAVILAHPDSAPARKDRPRSRVIGVGCASDWMRLGDRPQPGRYAGKQSAARSALLAAGLSDASRDVDVAELYDSYTGAEIQGIEAVGLCPEGQAAARLVDGEYALDGNLPVNVSGGLIGQGGAPGATGLAQAFTVSRLLEGRYHSDLQRDRMFRRGLIDCHTGVATVNVTHVLERVDP